MKKILLAFACIATYTLSAQCTCNYYPGNFGVRMQPYDAYGSLQIAIASDNKRFIDGFSGPLFNSRFTLGTDASANVYLRSINDVDLRLGVNSADYFVIKKDGNTGVGITSPSQKFEVNGVALFSGTSRGLVTTTGTYIGSGGIYSLTPGANANDLTIQGKTLTFYTGLSYDEKMRIDVSGNMGIGTTNPTEKLSVNGNIRAKKLIVEAGPWPDYVFADNYKLQSLQSLHLYIKKYNHLPGVRSAAEVEKNGIDVSDNQVLLLKKIEELTLHMIVMSKEMNDLKRENKRIRNDLHKKGIF